MINLECKNEKIKRELKDIIKMYVPFFEGDLNVSFKYCGGECGIIIDQKAYRYTYGGRAIYGYIKIQQYIRTKKNTMQKNHINPYQKSSNMLRPRLLRLNKKEFSRRLTKRFKKNLYLAMREHFDKGLAWGSLTGIRPSKIGYSFLAAGGESGKIADILCQKYYVSKPKAQIIGEIIQNQKGYIFRDESKVNLYVHIPFCPSKCHYCSFVSLPTAKNEGLIDDYLIKLCEEIKATKDLLRAQNKSILSIYIGGGTPTVLSESQLATLLSAIVLSKGISMDTNAPNKCAQNINTKEIEFTLEAGRPDTITEGKLRIMKEYGVNRISINPQTFQNQTLQRIGRSHTVESLIWAYSLAREYGFIINMDLIAGLEGETLDDFKVSINSAANLMPHNITVHTLSVKNGSKTFEKGHRHVGGVGEMLDYAYETLAQKGYHPYYLYRQKNMADSLENVGFCLKGYQSVNNITVMEESSSVWGVGAGAISKTVSYPRPQMKTASYPNPQKNLNKDKNLQNSYSTPNGSLINRHAELRDVRLYLENFDERLIAKLKFLAK